MQKYRLWFLRIFLIIIICSMIFSLFSSEVMASPEKSIQDAARNPSFLNTPIPEFDDPSLVRETGEQASMSPGDTIRVSVDSNGIQGNKSSDELSVSADGRYVAFRSYSSNLVSGDTNGGFDVFVHDVESSATTRVSIASDGTQGNHWASSPSISADGRYIAFSSSSDNLVSGDTNGAWDVFLRDTQTDTTTLISVSLAGTSGNDRSDDPSISADGRYIAFRSNASNLVDVDTNGNYPDFFVRDTLTNTTSLLSISTNGTQITSGDIQHPKISGDGRYVAFESSATTLVSGDTNGESDVFVHDRQTNATTRVSVASNGAQGNKGLTYDSLSISYDGRYISFGTSSSNLVFGDMNNASDIFVRDTQTNTTTRVSVNSSGEEGNHSSGSSSISADGRYVAFESRATNLVSGDTNGYIDIFVHDIQTGTTTRASTSSHGIEADNNSPYPSISGDGRFVVFESVANNLVSGDTNGVRDVFLHKNDFAADGGSSLPPLIIVHGWQGTNNDGGYQCSQGVKRYPAEGNSTLNSKDGSPDLADWFVEEGYEVWIAHLDSTPYYTPPLEFNAKCLRDQINHVYSQNTQPITIVAHSMGGLVSRAAIRKLDPSIDVKTLFTLGSPHAGIPFEALILSIPGINNFCVLQPAVCEMTPSYTSQFFNKNNPNLASNKVTYNFIGGSGGSGFQSNLLRMLGQGPNDGLVGQYSALGWHSGQVFKPSDWPHRSMPGQYFTSEIHSAKDNTTNSYYDAPSGQTSEAYKCIKAVMEGKTSSSSDWPQECKVADTQAMQLNSLEANALSSNQLSFTEIKTGQLDAGQEITLPFVIDSAGATGFYLTWSAGSAPSFRLTRPDMQVIDPAYALTHPEEVIYEASSGIPEAAPYAAYNFILGQVGSWQATITATDAIEYKVFGLSESLLSLDTQTDSNLYQIGDTATITANLDSSGAGITGATVTATLTRPDDVDDVISLIDQGNGTYTNTYIIPDSPGYLTIDVTTTGSDNGTAFTRQKNLLAAIAPNDLQLTGTYDDHPRDDDSDGQYDFLDFTIEVDLAAAGEYAVSAELYAGDQLIIHSGDFFQLDPGTQTITLPFYGGDIYEAGLDGPYTVKNLFLTPIDIGITAQNAENAWTTDAYSYTDFVDTVSPVVSNITRANSSPTSAASVNFTVTFSEPVTGVDIADFTLATTGVASASVSGSSGSGNTYTVTVTTGTGSGTIRLNLIDNDSIADGSGNLLGSTGPNNGSFTSGQSYSIFKSASFTDVTTTYWAWQYVERLYNAGVTGGCSTTPLSYCPENSVTRAQMAIFLEKGVHYPSGFSPANVSPTFTDTAGHWAEDWIEALRNDGITGGCGTNLYCPENPVTRAQMAVFLLKSKHGSTYTPPAVGTGTGFADVPTTHWAAPWIKQLAAEGITGGCGTGIYCPENSVTRAQMAVFLVKAFNLP